MLMVTCLFHGKRFSSHRKWVEHSLSSSVKYGDAGVKLHSLATVGYAEQYALALCYPKQ